MTSAVSTTSRRRFVRRQWRRRLRRPALFGVVVLGLLLAGWGVWFSNLLDVREVEVRGLTDDGLTASEVITTAKVPQGAPLGRVDLEAIRARVTELPAVRSAEVSRVWPHTIAVTVAERQAAAVWRTGKALRVVDTSGVAFRTVEQVPDGLLTVVTRPAGESADAERAAKELRAAGATVASAIPTRLAKRVELIVVGSVDGVRLRLSGGADVMWGSPAQSAQKARVLLALLPQDRQAYDVSVPDFPAVRE